MRVALNSHLLFVLFFLLAVLKPVNIPNINRYIGMFLMLLLLLVFIRSLFREHTCRRMISIYPLEAAAILIFLAINLIALAVNLERFDSYAQLIFFALASLAVWSAFFMSWVIFSCNEHAQGQWLGWGLLLLLAVVALWQLLDYPASVMLTQYFVSADGLQAKAISSITRWHTIYGVMAAVGCLVALQNVLCRNHSLRQKVFYLLLMLLLTYTGLMGESRNFLFTLAIGLVLFGFKFFLLKPKRTLIVLAFSLLLVHLVVLKNDSLKHEYGQVFPYIVKLDNAQVPHYRDFMPQINNHSLTGRADLWQQGYQLWQKSTWFGIGPGTYRATHSDDEQHRNLHNYYLQVLVDTGVFGFCVLLLLLFLLCRRAYQAKNLMIFIAILASLLFDNYLDYSFAWVFMMSWLLFISQQRREVTY